eukprot:7671879-Pyramimonas_sp.AAC.1
MNIVTSSTLPHAAKYLGIFLGRGGSVRSWDAPARKCLGQAIVIESLGLGLVKSIALFNQNGFSCLSCVSQFFSPPKSVHEAVRAAGQALVCGPRSALSPAMLENLTALGL